MKSRLSLLPALFAVLWFLSPPLATAEPVLSFDAHGITGSALVRGQANVLLLAFSATSDSAGSIAAIAVTYTGDAKSDIAAGSVQLFQDSDGDWSTSGDRTPLGSGQSFSGSGAVFSGLAVSCDSNTVCHFFVTASLSPSAAAGNTVSAAIDSPGDIASPDAAVTGSFPLDSLGGSPYHIAVTATGLSISPLPATVVAGQTVSVTVEAVDGEGTVDTAWTGSTLSIGGSPKAAPGAAPDGTAPSYSGGGAWTAADRGRKTCTFTLYKAESGRQIRFSDTSLGIYDEGNITVSPAASPRIRILPVANQTAGVPFTVTVCMTDRYLNPGTGYAGVVTTIAPGPGIGDSPAGSVPAFPAPYTWSGDEPQGQKVFSIVLYDRCTDGRLLVSGPGLEPAASNSFSVGEGALARYTVSGPVSVALKTKTTYMLIAEDTWGNALSKYKGTALISVSDAQAVVPVTAPVTAGTASFVVMFKTWGSQVIAVRDAGAAAVKGSLAVVVERAPAATNFKVTMPVSVDGGKSFPARITVCNDAGEAVTEYTRTVRLSVTAPASIRPETVVLANGDWQGDLTISGEALQVKLTVSDGQITTEGAGKILVGVPEYRKARTYPTVFAPARGPVRIRYFLREDRDVRVRIYNTVMDLVREIRFPAGSSGGSQGLNVIEWNGKGGDDESVGHSGAYHIMIDKGYEKEWTGAVIKNF